MIFFKNVDYYFGQNDSRTITLKFITSKWSLIFFFPYNHYNLREGLRWASQTFIMGSLRLTFFFLLKI
jgi:hypothetical protein